MAAKRVRATGKKDRGHLGRVRPGRAAAVRDWAGHSSVQETERYFHRVNRRAHARHVDGLDRYVQ